MKLQCLVGTRIDVEKIQSTSTTDRQEADQDISIWKIEVQPLRSIVVLQSGISTFV